MGHFKGDKGDPGTFEEVNATTVAADQPINWWITGDRGQVLNIEVPRGLPGVNAVPTDDAVATLLGAADSQTGGYAAARFARTWNVVGAGIDPTGAADSTTAINAIFAAASPGDTIIFPPGTYRKTAQTNVPERVTVRMAGATVRHESGTACFVMGAGAVIDGGFSGIIDMSDWAGAGGSRAHVRFGDYNTGVGVRGGAARGLTLTGGHDDINGVFVTGGSSDILVEDIYVPDSAKIGRPVLVHWGNSDNHYETPTPTHTPGSPTTHPHGITIRRIRTGKLTFTGGTVSVVCLSACYDVTVEDVTSEQCNELVNVFPGDYGFTYADPAVATIGMAGISIKRAVGYKVATVGVIVSGQPQFATGSRTRPRVVVEDARVYGGTSHGFTTTYSEDVEFRRCVAEGFSLLGFNAGNEARNTRGVDCVAKGNGRSGFGALGATGSEAYRSTFKRCRAFGNGTSGTVDNQKAGFVTQSARYTTVEECEAGGTTGETQLYGVYHSTNSIGDRIIGNEVQGVATGGTGIFVTSGYDSDTSVDRNRFGAGVLTPRNTLSARTPTVNGRREGQNTSAPTSGAWAVGDFVWNSAPAASGVLGWVCITAGTPGTWKPVSGIGA
jgi:hypothetical protein